MPTSRLPLPRAGIGNSERHGGQQLKYVYGGGLTIHFKKYQIYTKVKLIDNNICKLLCFNVLR